LFVFFKLAEVPVQFKPDTNAIDSKLWIDFVNEIFDGKRLPYFKSEEPTEYSGKGVRVLVGKDHDQITNDPNVNVFVEYYAPWCGHCKKLAPIWDQLAESFDNVENVVIAKMDSTQNDVASVKIAGFPTIFLYPAGSAPIKYEGPREYDDLKAFVELHGVGVNWQDESSKSHDEL